MLLSRTRQRLYDGQVEEDRTRHRDDQAYFAVRLCNTVAVRVRVAADDTPLSDRSC